MLVKSSSILILRQALKRCTPHVPSRGIDLKRSSGMIRGSAATNGEISTTQFHKYLCETAKLKMNLPDFRKTWSSVFLPGLIISEGLVGALKRNYPLILVSNTNEAHFEFIRSRYRIVDYFDHFVLSYEVDSLKPDRKIFEHAITTANCAPDSLFFIDDREENITAATRLGIHAHLFRSQSGLISALQSAGVEIGKFVD